MNLPPEVFPLIVTFCSPIQGHNLYTVLGWKKQAGGLLNKISLRSAVTEGAANIVLELGHVLPTCEPEVWSNEIRLGWWAACHMKTRHMMDALHTAFGPPEFSLMKMCDSVIALVWIVELEHVSDISYRLAWIHATEKGNVELMRALETRCSSAMPQTCSVTLSKIDKAIISGHIDAATHIWTANPGIIARKLLTYVCYAIKSGHSDFTRWFFQKRRYLWSKSVFRYVVQGCPRSVVEWALEHAGTQVGKPSIEWALRCKHIDTAKWLVKHCRTKSVLLGEHNFSWDLNELVMAELYNINALRLRIEAVKMAIRTRRLNILAWILARRADLTEITESEWAEVYENELTGGLWHIYERKALLMLHDAGVRPRVNFKYAVQAIFNNHARTRCNRLNRLLCEDYEVTFAEYL